MNDGSPFAAWVEKSAAEHVGVQDNCSLGRSPSNQVVLPDEKVSRRHALIHAQGEGEFWLVDLGSSNGTYLNGRRVIQPVRLHDHDRIQISQFQLEFRQPAAVRGAEALGQTTASATKTIVDIKSSPCWLLVADIEGSTTLVRKLSPEELPMVTGRWFSACKRIIENSGGTINKYLGDGFLAYWPEVSSDASALVRALTDLKALQAQRHPAFRVVIHRGHVFMGGLPSLGEESLLGNEVNFTFRMERLASSLGEACLASETAHTKLKAHLPGRDCGRHRLAGFEGEHALYAL